MKLRETKQHRVLKIRQEKNIVSEKEREGTLPGSEVQVELERAQRKQSVKGVKYNKDK